MNKPKISTIVKLFISLLIVWSGYDDEIGIPVSILLFIIVYCVLSFLQLIGNNTTTTYEKSNNYNHSSSETSQTTSNISKEKPLSKKQRIKQNKKNGIVCCPKCGSTSITTTNKKLSVKRGLVGLAINPLAGAVGAVTSKKIYNVCMNCGHRWKP